MADCGSTKKINLSYGATSLDLYFLNPLTVPPELNKNFTRVTLGNNTIKYDISGDKKKRWQITTETELSAAEQSDLFSLYDVKDSLTLTEDFIESSVAYNVFFEDLRQATRTFSGFQHYTLTLQEVG